MSEEKLQSMPVSGYQPQSQVAVDTVNTFKQAEERLLRQLDALAQGREGLPPVDGRWLAIGRTELENAFMAINRAIFQPQRVALPEDPAPNL